MCRRGGESGVFAASVVEEVEWEEAEPAGRDGGGYGTEGPGGGAGGLV